MRKLILLLLGLVLLLAPTGVAMAASMTGTDHDLSSSSAADTHNTDVDQICIFCHTPHKAQPAGGARPLWNHELTVQSLTWAPTTTVRGTTLPTDITSFALEGARACLSCHDGTVALGSVLRYFAEDDTFMGPTSFTMTGPNVISNKLTSGSHAYIDAGHMETNHPLGIQGPPADKVGFTPFVQSPPVPDNGVWYRVSSDNIKYVTCQSCHNPHLDAIAPFLRISNVGSALCKTCHAL